MSFTAHDLTGEYHGRGGGLAFINRIAISSSSDSGCSFSLLPSISSSSSSSSSFSSFSSFSCILCLFCFVCFFFRRNKIIIVKKNITRITTTTISKTLRPFVTKVLVSEGGGFSTPGLFTFEFKSDASNLFLAKYQKPI